MLSHYLSVASEWSQVQWSSVILYHTTKYEITANNMNTGSVKST